MHATVAGLGTCEIRPIHKNLHVSCGKCPRTVEIQQADAVRLDGPQGAARNACSTTQARRGPGA